MFRTKFGDPRPATREELEEAMEEREIDRDCVSAALEFVRKGDDPADPEKEGWSAEITDGESEISTRIWSSPSQLREDLRSVGVHDIEDRE